MPLKELVIPPGIVTVETDRGAAGRWKDGNNVRFYMGKPEKIGGYQKNNASYTFTGKARGIVDWQTLDLDKIIGIGTHLKLYVWAMGIYYDITPIRASSTINADPFAMVDTSTTVTVTDTAHGAVVDDYVTFSGASAAGGITVVGEYQIQSITDANTYTITHSSAATSTVSGGGAAVVAAYQIKTGSETTRPVSGFGAGTYGAGTYGTTRSIAQFLALARTWSLDNWGEDLIACPRGGAIYVWDASVGFTSNRATLISQAPATAKAIFVSDEDRHLVALGAYNGSADDPMYIAWCDAEDYTVWTAAEGNSAGDKRLDSGNEIYCAVKTKRETLIFTDSTLWSMTFIGPPYIYDFAPIGLNGKIQSPNAAKEYDGRVWWMGEHEFYVYDGSIRVVPCAVLNHVFDDLNTDQKIMVFAGANHDFGELWWLYPSADSDECDKFVLYNIVDNAWSFGELSRTVYVGDSKTFINPYALGGDGYLYDHESGVNADGSALSAYIESGDMEIGEGDDVMHVSRFVPDFKRLTGTLSLTLKGRKYPQSSTQKTKGPYDVTSSTTKLKPRIRARQIAIRLAVSSVGSDFRVGTLRMDAQPDGKR